MLFSNQSHIGAGLRGGVAEEPQKDEAHRDDSRLHGDDLILFGIELFAANEDSDEDEDCGCNAEGQLNVVEI